MKKTGSKNLKIIAATSMAIFSLFACFSAAYAWFVATRKADNGADSFQVSDVQTSVQELSIHEFLGMTTDDGSSKSYCFNPIPSGFADFSDDPRNPSIVGDLTITLDEYSLDDPNHPVLLLFKVNGGVETITAETLFPFIAMDKPGDDELDSNHIVASYSLLEAKKSSASDGEIFEVTADEHHGGTYEDEETYITTRYQYNAASDEFELVWTDLARFDNAFSSVAQMHSLLFTFDSPFARNGNNFVINTSSDGVSEKTYKHYNETSEQYETLTTDCVPVLSSDCNDSNQSSFTKFNSNNEATFEQIVEVYNGSTSGYTYLGVIIDYFPKAVEYLSSYFLGHHYLNYGLSFDRDWVTKI